MKKLILTFILSLLLSTPTWAADYWVAQSAAGGDDGSNCANAKSLAWFNSNAVAGDKAIMCDGSFTTDIEPTNDGTSGNQITYISQYEHDASGTQYAVISDHAELDSSNYITLDGIYFYDSSSSWVDLQGGTYNIVQNCKFQDSNSYTGVYLDNGSHYNQILDNVFPDATIDGEESDTNPADFIGLSKIGTDSNYNIVSGNTFGRVSHSALNLTSGVSNVVRNNTFQNEYHTGLILHEQERNLIENNYFYDQGDDYLNDPGPASGKRHNPAIQLSGKYHIIRGNILDNNGAGITLSSDPPYYGEYNRIYSNTINGSIRNEYSSYAGAGTKGCYFINNIFSNAYTYASESGANLYYDNGDGTERWYNNDIYGGVDTNYYENGWRDTADTITAYPTQFPSGNVDVDPLYTDENNRDFTLQSSSTLIDAGAYLTTISTATSTTDTFTVVDSTYFYDGWGIPGETGDVVMTESGVTGTISSINYSTHEIVLTGAISIVQNEGIALEYIGAAPDIGAEEFEFLITGASPVNNSVDVALSVAMTWDNSSGVTQVNVYFDKTTNPPTTKVVDGSDVETYDPPGSLDVDSDYYWKVEQYVNGEFIAGVVYKFSTTSGPPPTPGSKSSIKYHANSGGIIYHSNSGGIK